MAAGRPYQKTTSDNTPPWTDFDRLINPQQECQPRQGWRWKHFVEMRAVRYRGGAVWFWNLSRCGVTEIWCNRVVLGGVVVRFDSSSYPIGRGNASLVEEALVDVNGT